MTTWLPGAIEVLTHGLAVRPLAAAFLASRPAASMTEGFEVLVQEVIEAIATAPWVSSKVPLSVVTLTERDGSAVYDGSAAANDSLASVSWIRSWGRFGPAMLGTTVDRSSSSFSE